MSELKSIDYLMRDKKPGEIKIKRSTWVKTSYFRPYFKDDCGYWHGLLDHGAPEVNFCKSEDWKLYEEPKPKKKVVLYQWYSPNEERLSNYRTEEKAEYLGFKIKEGWQKIESTRLEIEVEE